VTEGFRDVLEIRRLRLPGAPSFYAERPRPLTEGLAPAPRQYVRTRLIEACELSRARGETVDDVRLQESYQRVLNELEVTLLESL
jgi:hypothetical protein